MNSPYIIYCELFDTYSSYCLTYSSEYCTVYEQSTHYIFIDTICEQKPLSQEKRISANFKTRTRIHTILLQTRERLASISTRLRLVVKHKHSRKLSFAQNNYTKSIHRTAMGCVKSKSKRASQHPTPSPPPTPVDTSGFDPIFVDECLRAHNFYRARHGVDYLRHDPELSRSAQVCL